MPTKKKPVPALSLASKAIDPSLDALFASSSGPVKPPSKASHASARLEKPSEEAQERFSSDADGDGELSDVGSGSHDDDDNPGSEDDSASASDAAETLPQKQPRKRKRKHDNDDLEDKYFAALTAERVPEPPGKRLKGEKDTDNDIEDVHVHESLVPETETLELDKARRTVFIGNVSTEAITSGHAKKTLMNHLTSVLGQDNDGAPQKLESIRFRSVAFSTGGMPKKAAFITKAVMNATTKSANAYAVFSSSAAARAVTFKLNGTEVLGRHIRVDGVAHPSPIDHRRCVFVGNLGFVDDETIVNTDSQGKTIESKRNKVPSDVEEGLWRTFGKQGRVENVRVVRDTKTRVGKGFAYVQFYDVNTVESALLLDGKRFPPMLPRPLRVTRAKDPRKTSAAQKRINDKTSAALNGTRSRHAPTSRFPRDREAATAGRAGKLLGRAGAALQRIKAHGRPFGATLAGKRSPEDIVFEGNRASSRDGRPKDLKLGGKAKGGRLAKPKGRSAARAAEWKKKGASKSR
ncbi:nucleolar protein 12 [Ophiocordyceps camponoti-floridani]|uniref:Nucleolar protein 12 n=1 Tax=Ophiocordyceps camponoti-floridani TaxID=2030778 RepID=A0A8H4VG27_9HYPO|nr:nucleolar protein 12 [Ophiocordyceps camponoti-floridani]